MNLHTFIHTYLHTYTHTYLHTHKQTTLFAPSYIKPTLIYVASLHYVLEYFSPVTVRNSSNTVGVSCTLETAIIHTRTTENFGNNSERFVDGRERKVTTKSLIPETSSLLPFKFIVPK